jgi:hypothetical protein
MVKEKDIHYKIFAGDTDWIVCREATNYAQRLKNLGFKARVIKRHYANPNYDVAYYKPKRREQKQQRY